MSSSRHARNAVTRRAGSPAAGGAEQHHKGPFDCGQTGRALRHPRILTTVSLEKKPAALWQREARRRAETQALTRVPGQENTRQHTDGHGQPMVCDEVQIFEKTGVRRHPATYARMREHSLPTQARLPGLRMRSPTRHGVWVTRKMPRGDVKVDTGVHRACIHTQQSLGWGHTWTAQASPQKDLLPAAASTGNLMGIRAFTHTSGGAVPCATPGISEGNKLNHSLSHSILEIYRHICNFPLEHIRGGQKLLLC